MTIMLNARVCRSISIAKLRRRRRRRLSLFAVVLLIVTLTYATFGSSSPSLARQTTSGTRSGTLPAGASAVSEVFSSPAVLLQTSSISCPSASVCYLSGAPAAKSLDGGLTWSFQNRPFPGGTTATSCASPTNCVAVDASAEVAVTSDGVTWQLPSGAGTAGFAGFGGVACPSLSTCFAAGWHTGDVTGGLAVSHDGGHTWGQVALPASTPGLRAISCPTLASCRAVGRNVSVYTDDGGVSWSSVPVSADPNLYLVAVDCPTAGRCMASGSTTIVTPTSRTDVPVIVRSLDGAQSWSGVFGAGNASRLNGLSCSSADSCVLVGLGLPAPQGGAAVAQTVPFVGSTATAASVLSELNGFTAVSCFGLHCVASGRNIDLNTFRDEAATSNDGGASWTASASPVTETLSDIACPTPTRCLAVGGELPTAGTGRGLVERTDDAGATWVPVTLPADIKMLKQVACPTANHCVALGFPSYILPGNGVAAVSDDGGFSWSSKAMPPDVFEFGDLQCPTTQHCVVAIQIEVAHQPSSEFPMSFVTSDDGGASWATHGVWPHAFPGALGCIDALRCMSTYFGGGDPSMLKSVDGGSSWTSVPSPPGGAIGRPLWCIPSAVCYAYQNGLGGVGIAATNDLGSSWHGSVLSVAAGIRGGSCSSRTCLIVGGGQTPLGTALSSFDGGVSWAALNMPASVHALDNVACPTAGACFAIGTGSQYGSSIVRIDLGPAAVTSPPPAPWTIRPNGAGNPEDFVVGGDGQMYHRYLSGGTYTAWSSLGALPGDVDVASRQVSFGVNYANNAELYIRGVDGNIYHDYATPGAGSGWSGLSSLSQPVVGSASDVSVGRNYLDNQEMYVVGNDGQVYHRYATPGSGPGWSGWDPMGAPAGTSIRFGVHVGRNFLNNQELYVVGTDGVIYHNFATPGVGSGWNGWDPMASIPGVVLRGDLNVGLNFLGNQELYAVGSDNRVYHNYSTPGLGTGWSSWSTLGSPPTTAMDGTIDLEYFDYRALGKQDILVRSMGGGWFELDSTPGRGTGWSNWVQRF